MTTPPHGQVPEALRLAEQYDHGDPAAHGNAWKAAVCTELRRLAELEAQIEALSGVQALSAAPEAKKSALRTYPNPIVPLIKPVSEQEKMRALYLASSNLMAYLGRKGAIHSDGHAADVLMNCLNDLDGGEFDETLFAASPTPTAEQQAAPKAAPGVGNSGFDHKTAADFLNGKTVSDEAVRTFVATSRWAHDERAALSATLLAMHGVLTSREAEIALLKKALMEAEAAPQQEVQEPAVDDPNRWFTVVYRDISAGDEARLLGEHPKASAMSWSHAIRDRDAARAARAVLAKWGAQPQAGAEPLTGGQIKGLIEDGVFFGNCKEIVRAIEAAHGITQKGG